MAASLLMSLTLFSPAKVNLFFRVLKRREDGYHEIASLFQAINLGDHLTLSFSEKDEFTSSDHSLPCDGSNLVQKAIELFRLKTKISFCVKAHLEKKIPIQAGLGGGSSNAATTLWGLNKLHNHIIPSETLQIWGAEIGSDVPFFFSEGSAYCTGRGEKVLPLTPWAYYKPLFLFKPEGGLSTPLIYRTLDLKKCHDEDPQQLLVSFKNNHPIFINDLESSAFAALPLLEKLKTQFQSDGFEVVMTGSGTTLLLIGEGKLDHAQNLLPIKIINRKSDQWYQEC